MEVFLQLGDTVGARETRWRPEGWKCALGGEPTCAKQRSRSGSKLGKIGSGLV